MFYYLRVEPFGFSFGLLSRISGSRLPNEGISTDSAVACVSQCALTMSICVSCVRMCQDGLSTFSALWDFCYSGAPSLQPRGYDPTE